MGQWQACIAGGGCAEMPAMRGRHGRDARPQRDLQRRHRLCRLARPQDRPALPAAERGGVGVRRPGAARPPPTGGATRLDGSHVICRKCGGQGFVAATPPAVASQPPNPWGLVGMSGGVREWLADCWIRNYDKAPADARAAPGQELPAACHPRRLLARRAGGPSGRVPRLLRRRRALPRERLPGGARPGVTTRRP